MEITERLFDNPDYQPEREQSDVQRQVTQGLYRINPANLHASPIRSDVQHIRAKLPFVAIMPFPKMCYMVTLVPGVAQDINIPSGSLLVKLAGIAPFYCTDKGNADGIDSIATQSQGTGNPDWSVNFLVSQETDWMYCPNLRKISVMSKAIGNVVSARFITRDEI